MKTVINFCGFCDEFVNMNRENSFSYEGKQALFEHLTELEESCDMEIELDVIALDCDYVEYTIKEALKEYSMESLEDLRNNTTVIPVGKFNPEDEDSLIIIQSF